MKLLNLLSSLMLTAWLTLAIANAKPLESSKCNVSTTTPKNRVFILSDISNEPDDAMSFVRLLLHSNKYQIEGIVAVTSWWLNSSTFPSQIQNIVTHYGLVYENLQTHDNGGFPTSECLSSIIRSGSNLYGFSAIEALENGGNISAGAQLLIDRVDDSDSPLYVQIWAGANCLGEALWCVRKTRSSSELGIFISKLRVYSISDQDDVGPWIRQEFPEIRYIASSHGWNQYGLAAWTGISGEGYYHFDQGGPETDLVSDQWIAENIQIGPLGSVYPNVSFVMEGDFPSLLFNMDNGLNVPEHPEYGGWGGRYIPSSIGSQHFADVADWVIGKNGGLFVSNHATIWRWRNAYQNEMAARIQWTLGGNVTTVEAPVLIVNGSCGTQPLEITAEPNTTITLDATGTYNPTHCLMDNMSCNATELDFKWWHYQEISATQWNVPAEVPELNISTDSTNRTASFQLPVEADACSNTTGSVICQVYHVILEVTNHGVPPLTRYRRVIIKIIPGIE